MTTEPSGRLAGKIALVTGGSRGIGRAIAERLAAEGADVALFYAGNEAAAREATQAIEGMGRRALMIRCDVSDAQAAAEAVASVKASLGPVDILVNNAGITRDGLAMRLSAADFDAVISTNLSGAFYVLRAVLPDLIRRRAGRVINIASVAGVMGNAGQANYAASKAGMIGMTKSVAREVASRGITVNCVAPGFVKTDMTRAMGGALDTAIAGVPAARAAEPREIAAAVAFLAGDEAGYITGCVLPVDGGLSM